MTRYTSAVGIADLKAHIQGVIQQYPNDMKDEEDFLYEVGVTHERQVETDLHQYIQYENIVTDIHTDPTDALADMIGYHQWGHVATYGFIAGQDYGTPVFAIVYLDENRRLRGFIPLTGNAFNPVNGLQFGEDSAADDRIAKFLGYTCYGDLSGVDPVKQALFYDKAKLITSIVTNIHLAPAGGGRP